MKLFLEGHNYKYALEQMLFTIFPKEHAEYPSDRGNMENSLISTLYSGDVMYTAMAKLQINSRIYTGRSGARKASVSDAIDEKRVLQRIIKLAFYRAALSYTGKEPEWGALTGVRPGKIAERYLSQGLSSAATSAMLTRKFYVSKERARLCTEVAECSLKIKNTFLPCDISLYVGIPFCPTRCAYCSFVSQSVEKSVGLIAPFVSSLLSEIAATGKIVRAAGLRPVSIYIGGGTPTTLTARQLDEMMGALEKSFDLSYLTEYTVEAGRPDTITSEKLAVLKSHGVSRISVNPQTLNDNVLEVIGRKHNADDIYKALAIVRNSGIPDVNMDLIAGLPSDTAPGFERTVSKVLDLRPENITIHTLAMKRGSNLWYKGTAIPGEDEVNHMINMSITCLRESGYSPYYLYRQKYMSGGFENVGWSLPSHINIYNIVMMEELHSVISMGAGGATKLIRPGDHKIERIFNQKYPREYIGNISKNIENKKRILEVYNGI